MQGKRRRGRSESEIEEVLLQSLAVLSMCLSALLVWVPWLLHPSSEPVTQLQFQSERYDFYYLNSSAAPMYSCMPLNRTTTDKARPDQTRLLYFSVISSHLASPRLMTHSPIISLSPPLSTRYHTTSVPLPFPFPFCTSFHLDSPFILNAKHSIEKNMKRRRRRR